MHRFIRLCKDAEPKDWSPPLQGVEPRKGKCTGGSMADSVESLIGALFLSTDSLHKVLSWIDQIKLVPLQALDQLNQFASFAESTFTNLKQVDLQHLPFNQDENLQSLFDKYF